VERSGAVIRLLDSPQRSELLSQVKPSRATRVGNWLNPMNRLTPSLK